MKRLYDFRCEPCDLVTEEYTEYKTTSTCPSCGGETTKTIGTPHVKLEGVSGAFPGAAIRWEKMHRQRSNQRD